MTATLVLLRQELENKSLKISNGEPPLADAPDDTDASGVEVKFGQMIFDMFTTGGKVKSGSDVDASVDVGCLGQVDVAE